MTDFNKMAESLIAGDRRALSRAITLVESSREDHRKSAISLISLLEKKSEKQAIRIGLSGTPGVLANRLSLKFLAPILLILD